MLIVSIAAILIVTLKRQITPLFWQRIIQGRAETICDHAEAFGEKCFCHRHTHRSALGEGVMDALRLGGRIDAGGHRKALWLIETLGQAAGGI